MKKILSLLLIFTLIFCFSACGKDKNTSSGDSLDLEYYANLGKIPECDYALSDDADKVNNELKAKSENVSSGEEVSYNFTEGENNSLIENGEYLFYFVNKYKEKGISYIVSYDTAYGFEIGTVSVEIKKALSQYDDVKEIQVNKVDGFFTSGIENISILKYEFKNSVVDFILQDNALYATAIYNKDIWKN